MEQQLNQPHWYRIQEVELVYKTKVDPSHRPILKESKYAYDLLLQSWNENKIQLQEQFKVLLLNKALGLLGIFELSTGGICGTVADPRLIFCAALKAGACCIILSHNHPSGNLRPSKADELLTQKLKEAGKWLEIAVLDHLIIGQHGYFSFA